MLWKFWGISSVTLLINSCTHWWMFIILAKVRSWYTKQACACCAEVVRKSRVGAACNGRVNTVMIHLIYLSSNAVKTALDAGKQ